MEAQENSRVKGIISGKKKRILLFGIIAVLLAGGFATFSLIKSRNTVNASVRQRTARAEKGEIVVSITGSATLASSNSLELNPSVTGIITKVYFKEGDRVKAGDLLYEIDDSDARLELEGLKNSIAQARLTVDSNSKSIGGLQVTAPFDGVVTGIVPETGDEIAKNSDILTITNTGELEVSLPFSAAAKDRISEGMSATVNIVDLMQTVEGRVTYISGYSYTTASGGEVYDVEISIENPGSLAKDMTASGEIATGSGTVLSASSGKLRNREHKVLKSIAGGTVTQINVRENQHVRAGQVLIQLENDDLVVSSKTAELKLEDLNTQLATAEAKMEDYRVYAPIDGIIVSQEVEEGNEAGPSKSLCTISDMDNMAFAIDIDELDISKIQTGQKANITIDAIEETEEQPIVGSVTHISMVGTSSNGVTTYPVTIKLDDSSGIMAGMNANAEVLISERTDILVIPLEAVQSLGGQSYVIVKEGEAGTRQQPAQGDDADRKSPGNAPGGEAGPGEAGDEVEARRQEGGQAGDAPAGAAASRILSDAYYQGAEMRAVELGINNDSYIEVISGLEEGEEIILPAQAQSGTGTTTGEAQSMPSGGMNFGMPGGGAPSGGGAPGGGGGGGPR